MIHDLAHAEGSISLTADIGIVGAGIAGLVLAVRLARAGLKVIVLESGNEKRSSFADELNEVAFSDRPYRGAISGRVRGLGGTSAIWGGALLPFLAEDL